MEIRTLGRSLDILEAILRHGEGVKLVELADMTGLSISTVHRLASFLTKRGYLYRKSKGDKYFLGYKLFLFNAARTSMNMQDRAYPFLRKLSDDLSESAVMSVLDGIEQVSIVSINPKNAVLQAVPGAGTKTPLYCTSTGKVLLANMPGERIEYLINTLELTPYTDKTVTDVLQLKREIETIKLDGVAYDDEEYESGIRSIAAPVKDESGNVLAAIAVVGPSVRISSMKMRQLAPIVRSSALEISQSLGLVGK